MLAKLQHQVCVLNITDELSRECEGHEYKKGLLSIIILQDMHTHIQVNGADVHIDGNALCFLTHYQPVIFDGEHACRPIIIQFNADVFCIQKHDSEIGCNGTLFNSLYDPPVLHISSEQLNVFNSIVQQMLHELKSTRTGGLDMLESYLKQFLIHAVRIKKVTSCNKTHTDVQNDELRMLQFRKLVGEYYRDERKLGFYADSLHVSESYLHKLVKKFTGRNFTCLMSDKLLLDAKSLLFVTNDTVKEISYELGFNDPAYFSRFFKKLCGVTPEQYRQTIRNCPVTV